MSGSNALFPGPSFPGPQNTNPGDPSIIGRLNTSVPLQAGQGVTPIQLPNPLQAAGQAAQLRNALNQNALFPGQFEQQQQSIQANQAKLVEQWRQQGAAALTPLLAKSGPITLDEVAGAMGAAERSGISTQPTLAGISHLNPGDPAAFDAGVRAYIKANAQPFASAAEAVTPRQIAVDRGPAIQPMLVAPPGMAGQGVYTPVGPEIRKDLGPQFVQTPQGAYPTNYGQPLTAAPTIRNGLSQVDLAQPTQIGVVQSGPNKGAPIMGTREQFLNQTGTSPFGNGRLPSALRNPSAPPQVVVTGLGPAQAAAAAETGSQSAKAFQDITTQGIQARNQSAVLGNMLADASQFAVGPEKINDFRKTLTRYAPSFAASFGVDPKSVAANESFDKLANQLADAQGAGSDARLAVTQHANPSSALSPGGVDLILRQLQGNSDYLQARQRLAAAWPDTSDRRGFEEKAGNIDPRAFQFERMTPQQKVEYAKSLSEADLTKVKKAYNYAATNGLFGVSDQ